MAERSLQVRIRQTTPMPLDVSLTCAAGQVLAVFGPSGAGKTTVLRTIAGLHIPAEGRIALAEQTWLDTATATSVPPHQRAVGFVFQDYALFPHLTALGNVMLALGHLPRHERRARAVALLTQVHLEGRMDRRPASLSGGERQRVALARAVARDPGVLLLDEPFAAVDRSLRRALQDGIADLRRAIDIPVLLVTHDFEDVVRLATHLAVIERGVVVADGALPALTARPDVPWLRQSVGMGVVWEATVECVESARGLASLTVASSTDGPAVRVWTSAGQLTSGTRVRLRVPARDVILATSAPEGLSVHNVFSGRVAAMHDAGDDGAVVVHLDVGIPLLAEVTRDAVVRLAIAPGRALHALVKSVSIEVL